MTFGISPRMRSGRFGVRVPVGARDFSFLQNVKTGSGTHPASYSVGTGSLFRVRVSEVDHSSASND